MWEVYEHRRVVRQVQRTPTEILKRYEKWKDIVRLSGPAGRWCREALFFLVWSCPQPVVAAQMCELAGILD